MIIETLWRELVIDRLMGEGKSRIMRPHAGKTMRIEAGPMKLAMRVDKGGSLHPVHPAVTADATIKVPFARLAGDASVPTHAEGDSELLSAFGKITEDCDFAPDALVERAFGKDAGSVAAVCCRKARAWGKDSSTRLSGTFADWLTKEGRILPDPAESQALTREISEFARKVKAIDKRVATLAGAAGGS